jgi:hypothetical protein
MMNLFDIKSVGLVVEGRDVIDRRLPDPEFASRTDQYRGISCRSHPAATVRWDCGPWSAGDRELVKVLKCSRRSEADRIIRLIEID